MTIRTVLFWTGAACCVVAELAILRSLLFGRAAPGAPSGDRPATAPALNRGIEVAWALLPAAGLLLVLYLTWRAVDAPRPPVPVSDRGGLTVGA